MHKCRFEEQLLNILAENMAGVEEWKECVRNFGGKDVKKSTLET
jgi:hypothetical protein